MRVLADTELGPPVFNAFPALAAAPLNPPNALLGTAVRVRHGAKDSIITQIARGQHPPSQLHAWSS